MKILSLALSILVLNLFADACTAQEAAQRKSIILRLQSMDAEEAILNHEKNAIERVYHEYLENHEPSQSEIESLWTIQNDFFPVLAEQRFLLEQMLSGQVSARSLEEVANSNSDKLLAMDQRLRSFHTEASIPVWTATLLSSVIFEIDAKLETLQIRKKMALAKQDQNPELVKTLEKQLSESENTTLSTQNYTFQRLSLAGRTFENSKLLRDALISVQKLALQFDSLTLELKIEETLPVIERLGKPLQVVDPRFIEQNSDPRSPSK